MPSFFRTSVALVAAISSLQTSVLLAQDNNIRRNEVYPAEMFRDKGGRMLDVTRLTTYGIPEFTENASIADDKHDDSKAIIDAMNWVAQRRRNQLGEKPGEDNCVFYESWLIYFPNGVYNVSKSIGYTGPKIKDCGGVPDNAFLDREGTAGFKLIGQSREKVIIRLANNLPAFNGVEAKPVILFSSPNSNLNVAPAGFHFRNITIDCGNNTAAVGLDYYGANNSRLDNVIIIGSPKNKQAGLDLRIATAHGYYSNLTVTGFKYGIRMNAGNGSSCPTLEYITLKGQTGNAIVDSGSAVSMRRIESINNCTAIMLASVPPHGPASAKFIDPSMVLIDSKLQTVHGAKVTTAIEVKSGVLFARNIRFGNYITKIAKAGIEQPVASTAVLDEYLSDGYMNFNADGKSRVRTGKIKSLNLPVEEVPLFTWENPLTKWQLVSGGADDEVKTKANGYDDGPAIEAAIAQAIATGKNVLYFPKNYYRIRSKSVDIPPAIEQLIGLDTHLLSPADNKADKSAGYAFTISKSSSKMLVVNAIAFTTDGITQNANRTVYFEGSRSRKNLYQYTAKGGQPNLVFANCTNRFGVDSGSLQNTHAYGRFVDNEKKVNDGQFHADGKTCWLWMLGCKVEPTFTIFHTTAGANLEVLGSLAIKNRQGITADNPVIFNEGANVSVTFVTHGTVPIARFWLPVIRDIQRNKTYTVLPTELRDRGYDDNKVLPLYVSYAVLDGSNASGMINKENSSGDDAIGLPTPTRKKKK